MQCTNKCTINYKTLALQTDTTQEKRQRKMAPTAYSLRIDTVYQHILQIVGLVDQSHVTNI